MVERPIKKSERQDNPDASNSSALQPKKEERRERSDRGKGKGKGKKGSRKEEAPKAVNLALVRPPKPGKAKPPVIEEVATEVTEDDAIAASTEEVTDENPTPTEAGEQT